MFGKEKITADEAVLIREIASKCSLKISSECGPYQSENISGNVKRHTNISGFDLAKARQIIEEGFWDLLLKL